MRGLALALALVTFGASAQPADAPVREIIKAGQPAPANGCFLNDRACVDTGKELADLRTQNASLKKSLEGSTTPMFVGLALVLGLVGGAAGAVYVLRR